MTSTSSLQLVSVDLVPWNLCNLAKWPSLHLYRWWVSIWCYEICIILLNDFTLSLQGVSVDLVPWNLCNFSEWPPLCLYRGWVLIWCHEICVILLNDLCFISTGSERQFSVFQYALSFPPSCRWYALLLFKPLHAILSIFSILLVFSLWVSVST